MVKTLTHHGNSAALIIDKPILELLDITFETPLEITTDGRNLLVTPIRNKKTKKNFRAALAFVNRYHGKSLKALAE